MFKQNYRNRLFINPSFPHIVYLDYLDTSKRITLVPKSNEWKELTKYSPEHFKVEDPAVQKFLDDNTTGKYELSGSSNFQRLLTLHEDIYTFGYLSVICFENEQDAIAFKLAYE